MKIAYYSVAPFCSSGFGVCTRYMAYYLAQKHQVDIYSYYGYEGIELEFAIENRKVKIIGGNSLVYHPLFFERYSEYDVQITHFDAWLISKQLANLKDANMIHWCVIQHAPIERPFITLAKSEGTKLLVPMTQWAKKVLLSSKHIPKEKVTDPILHGADPNVFYPENNATIDFLPESEFTIVAVIDNNGMRENVPETIEAFGIFIKNTDADAILYLHTEPQKYGGYNLYEVISAVEDKYDVKIHDKVFFKPHDGYFTTHDMRKLFNVADCIINAVKGGSFEIPIVEAGLCETPAIVTYWGATAELIGNVKENNDNLIIAERGVGVKPVAFIWMNRTSSRQSVINVDDLAEAIELYYTDKQLVKKHGKVMRSWVLQNCTWDIVGEKWLKLLDEIDGDDA